MLYYINYISLVYQVPLKMSTIRAEQSYFES